MKPLAEMGRFKTVVVDPPWDLPGLGLTKRTSVEGYYYPQPYESLSIEQVCELPVADVLEDDAVLFCWTVNKFLPYTFDVIERWGLRYSFTMSWIKERGIQTPVSPCFNTEWAIVGKKGSPQWLETRAFRAGNFWGRGQPVNSAKPEGFYDLLRRVTPGPRLDIFGRRRIAGFHSWGDEAPEGEPEPDHYQMVLA